MGEEVQPKRRMPMREVIIILALIIVAVLLILPVWRTSRTAVLTHSCAGNLKQWGAIFDLYRKEHGEVNPPPHGFEKFGPAENAAGCSNIDDAFDFAPQVHSIFPEYANDLAILACPDGPGLLPAVAVGPAVFKAPRLDPGVFKIAEGTCEAAGSITRPSASYTYLGYEIHRANDTDPQITLEQAIEFDLPASGPANVVALLARIRPTIDNDWEEVQRLRTYGFIAADYLRELGYPYTDLMRVAVPPLSETAKSPELKDLGVDRRAEVRLYPTLAVMWDAIYQDTAGEPVFHHNEPVGCNVLYMDGHVEFKTYPSEFPVSKGFATMEAVR